MIRIYDYLMTDALRKLKPIFGMVGLLFYLQNTVYAQTNSVSAPPSSPVVYTDTLVLEGFIRSNQTLTEGAIYVVNNNVKISKGAILSIPKNVKILFEANTTIVVEGGLQVAGAPKEFVQFSSLNDERRGVGLVVRGTEGADISIRYAIFSKLNTPMHFELDWFRNNVVIEHNVFRDMNTGESNILITNPSNNLKLADNSVSRFIFNNNNFVNNWGSIFVENFQDNILDLTFSNNLFTNNVVYGIDKGIPSNTPLFGLFDDKDRKYTARIFDNSMYGNYQINASTDTIIREISLGIQGDGESLVIPSNFFRSKDLAYISTTFDHFYQNNTLPLLIAEPIRQIPSEKAHAHIYKVHINGLEVLNYDAIPDVPTSLVNFEVYFNRPVTEFGETQLESVYFDTINNGVKINKVPIKNTSFSADRKIFYFQVENAVFMRNKLGYMVFLNFLDDEGFEVPEFTIGQKNAINAYSRLYNEGKESTYISPAALISGKSGFFPDERSIKALEALSELGDLSYLGAYTSLAKTWEVGLLAGTSNYFGDVGSKVLDVNRFRFSFGLFGQYNISRWFSARISANYARIEGTDLLEVEPARRKRNTSFRTDIFEGSLIFRFHVLQYGVSKGERFSPSIYAGLSVFYYDPKARLFIGFSNPFEPNPEEFKYYQDQEGRDVWFKLRQIGTEGQTVNQRDPEFPDRQQPAPYKNIALAFPMGISLDFIIKKSWVVGFDLGFRVALTDYLDDISGFHFDRNNFHQLIADANNDIKGRVRTGFMKWEDFEVPRDVNGKPVVTFDNPSGNQTIANIHPAILLANPSLITNLDLNPNEGTSVNAAYDFVSAKRGTINRDWWMTASVKVSKVIGYDKKQRRMEEKQEKLKQEEGKF